MSLGCFGSAPISTTSMEATGVSVQGNHYQPGVVITQCYLLSSYSLTSFDLCLASLLAFALHKLGERVPALSAPMIDVAFWPLHLISIYQTSISINQLLYLIDICGFGKLLFSFLIALDYEYKFFQSHRIPDSGPETPITSCECCNKPMDLMMILCRRMHYLAVGQISLCRNFFYRRIPMGSWRP